MTIAKHIIIFRFALFILAKSAIASYGYTHAMCIASLKGHTM